MSLAPGVRLGVYEIVSAIGAGGMGEVYKARDSRLNRTVAIKVLPAHFADTERKQRFEREAQAIAALNHPHICIVHDVGEHEGTDFLVMEFLDGETLADRLARGPLPIDQVLSYGIQIGDALDKAHRQGITHRDLKPGNVIITKTGVKLLDFGLAKLEPPVATVSSQSIVPTLVTGGQPLTVQGTILGTLQYMSPEQLEGREADARSDIFAFGALLYEMATGRPAFVGKSQVSLIAAILEHEPPPVSSLQQLAPPLFDDVVRICLAKNPDDRWQSAADVGHELQLVRRHTSAAVSPAAATGVAGREQVFWGAAVVVAAMAAAAAIMMLRRPVDPAKVSFEIQDAATTTGNNSPFMIALSPDGRSLAARVTENGVQKLWVRPLERVTGFTPPGTDGAAYPFWAPDGRYVGFFAGGQLKKVDVFGAPPQTLATVSENNPLGGAWSANGVILFNREGPLFRIAAAGGDPAQATQLDKARGEISHRFPRFLPDGVHFLYLAISAKPEESAIRVGSLDSKDSKRLVSSIAKAEFCPPDLLLFLRESTLMAQRFDPRRLELSGDPFQVAEHVGWNGVSSATGFTVSENGVLAYRFGGAVRERQLTWVDRSGKTEGTVAGASTQYENPRLSPDGKRLAIYKPEGGGDIWITDLERGNSSRFTFDTATDNDPVWSPDGTHIAFVSNRDGGVFNLYQKNSGGTGDDELLLKTANNKLIDDWSADGRYILYEELDPKTKSDLWALPVSGDRKPTRFLATPFNETQAALSPDGRWIAYTSDETGTQQVYVQRFPAGGSKWQISAGGRIGASPRWRSDGRELYYDAGGPLMTVDVDGSIPGGEFKAGVPRQLFATGLQNLPPHNYDVASSGQRFLLVMAQNIAAGPAPIVVVVNWKTGLKP